MEIITRSGNVLYRDRRTEVPIYRTPRVTFLLKKEGYQGERVRGLIFSKHQGIYDKKDVRLSILPQLPENVNSNRRKKG